MADGGPDVPAPVAPAQRRWPVRPLLLLLSLLLSALLVLSAVVLYHRHWRLDITSTAKTLGADDLRQVTGAGVVQDTGLRVDRLDADGSALISSAALRLDATELNRLDWWIEGIDDGVELELLWALRDEPQTLHFAALSAGPDDRGSFDLTVLPAWRDFVGAVGLRVSGTLSAPVTVRQLRLSAAPPTPAELLLTIGREWTEISAWQPRSVNFIVSGPRLALAPAAPVVAAVIAVSLPLYLLLTLAFRRRQGAARELGVALLVGLLAGWLLLDLRWQIQLFGRLALSREFFAAPDSVPGAISPLDADLARFAADVRTHLPDRVNRLFILKSSLSPDADRYLRLRMRYHLIPNNVYADPARSPPAPSLQPGDFVIAFLPTEGVEYDTSSSQLLWQGRRLPVELLLAQDLGLLFRIDDGAPADRS